MITSKGAFVREFGVAASLAFVLGASGAAHAYVMGERHIASDTALTTDQYGSVVFDADNITLDCRHYKVHSSSATRTNCHLGDLSAAKCGIVANGRQGITIKNCDVVGQFDYGVSVDDSAGVTLRSVSVTITGTAFWLRLASAIDAGALDVHGGAAGFDLDGASGSLSNVYVENVAGAGILSGGSESLTFSGLTVQNAGGYGYDGVFDSSVALLYSTFAFNGGGVRCSGCYDFELVADELSSNTLGGINLSAGYEDVIAANVATGNGRCDADADAATVATWTNNDLGRICGSVPKRH